MAMNDAADGHNQMCLMRLALLSLLPSHLVITPLPLRHVIPTGWDPSPNPLAVTTHIRGTTVLAKQERNHSWGMDALVTHTW